MSYPDPSPGSDIPTHIVEGLDDQSPKTLRQIAYYAEQLAEHQEREQRLAESEETEDETMNRPDDLPADVPSKATITVKEINDNRYYYWQWRDGDKIKSKYKGPANSDS
ncbi:hypothetical protein [Haladaptatus salinisoli]|uniref:hypothetical protein n=1 Tax=Haladaptatus salinisoli TaxID=2884876 RepID=UPI001D0A8745|nr:hypothetical protein [Haladaptatus salinisoli]